MDGHVLGAREGEAEEHTGTCIGDDQAGRATEDGDEQAFGEELADDAGAHGSEGGSDGDLGAAGHAANQQEVGILAQAMSRTTPETAMRRWRWEAY